MQMRISDAGAAGKCQRVSIAECGNFRIFQSDIVPAFLILGLLNQGVERLRKTAEVRKDPSAPAFSLKVDDLAVKIGRDLDPDDFSLFRSQDREAFLHFRGIVDARMVTRSPIFSEGRGEKSRLSKWHVQQVLSPKHGGAKEKAKSENGHSKPSFYKSFWKNRGW